MRGEILVCRVCGELVEYDGELLEARVIRDMPLAWVFSVRQKILFYRYRPGWHGVCLKIIVGETCLGKQCLQGVEIFWCSGWDGVTSIHNKTEE